MCNPHSSKQKWGAGRLKDVVSFDTKTAPKYSEHPYIHFREKWEWDAHTSPASPYNYTLAYDLM